MIVATAVCPHPPLLLRELTGAQDVAADLRGVCESAVSVLLSTPGLDRIVVVGGADTSRGEVSGRVPTRIYADAARRGPEAEGAGRESRPPTAEPLPLSLGIARRLLDSVAPDTPVEMVTVAWDASAEEVERVARAVAGRAERVGLLVMGDGGARWGVREPGHLDAASVDVDEVVRHALADGDTGALTALDPEEAADQMVAGRAALQVMASAVVLGGTSVGSELLYADAPFGVTYFVAVWSCASC
ncbi:hypothetical protein KIK06_04000 [Nocardiopsis sp. EMB25]|uniref:hypothetical protein n=1 Tax=Nocardiopsis sp. EMB25 TaxID=2835867 RepID=UPI00228526BE|nr:hypothetical protein [Nocardiopsis sp. EMB25]MCY9783051.1 hypothetical protein [Nocardiopsis sp. EMB25]